MNAIAQHPSRAKFLKEMGLPADNSNTVRLYAYDSTPFPTGASPAPALAPAIMTLDGLCRDTHVPWLYDCITQLYLNTPADVAKTYSSADALTLDILVMYASNHPDKPIINAQLGGIALQVARVYDACKAALGTSTPTPTPPTSAAAAAAAAAAAGAGYETPPPPPPADPIHINMYSPHINNTTAQGIAAEHPVLKFLLCRTMAFRLYIDGINQAEKDAILAAIEKDGRTNDCDIAWTNFDCSNNTRHLQAAAAFAENLTTLAGKVVVAAGAEEIGVKEWLSANKRSRSDQFYAQKDVGANYAASPGDHGGVASMPYWDALKELARYGTIAAATTEPT